MKVKFSSLKAKSKLPKGFFYIGQDNYYIANLNDSSANAKKYLYSDSATSCIIIIVEGKDKDNNPIVALSHLSRPDRFQAFFKIVANTFCGSVNIFAQGANPPEPSIKDGKSDFTSLLNVQIVINWVNKNIYIPSDTAPIAPKWYIAQSTLSLGMGNPQQDNRGCYGIDLKTMVVSNQQYELELEQRDPTGGTQTLFCVFGLKIVPQIVLQLASRSFTGTQIGLLVDGANKENWTDILNMTDEEVLNNYSSTPEYEAPWFAETLIESAKYVNNYIYKK